MAVNLEAEVRAHVEAMERVTIDRDAKKLGQFYSPDATLVTKGVHLQGRGAIEKYFAGVFGTVAGGHFQAKNNIVELIAFGNLASVRGDFNWTSGTSIGTGDFIFVLKRMADGKWYTHHDFFTLEMDDKKDGEQ